MVPFIKSRKQNEISSRPSFSSKRKGEGVQGWGGHRAGPAGGSVWPPLLLPPRGGKHQEPSCASWASAPECQQPQRSRARVVEWGRLPPPSGFYNPLLISRRWHASDPCVHFARRPSLTAPSPFWRCLSRAGRLGSRCHPTPRGGERGADPRPPLWDPSEWHRAPGYPRGVPQPPPEQEGGELSRMS